MLLFGPQIVDVTKIIELCFVDAKNSLACNDSELKYYLAMTRMTSLLENETRSYVYLINNSLTEIFEQI